MKGVQNSEFRVQNWETQNSELITHNASLPLLLGNLADRAAAQERRSLLKIWCGAAVGTAISLVLGLNALNPQFILGASLQSAGIATAIAALCKGRIGSKP